MRIQTHMSFRTILGRQKCDPA